MLRRKVNKCSCNVDDILVRYLHRKLSQNSILRYLGLKDNGDTLNNFELILILVRIIRLNIDTFL